MAFTLLSLTVPAPAADWIREDLGGRALFRDSAWTEPFGWGPPPAPLASDTTGRLYLANGSNLLCKAKDGSPWTALPRTRPDAERNAPLAAGARDIVLWGDFGSRDGGATWDTLTNWRYQSVLEVLPDGSALQGTSNDFIYRSSLPHRDWEMVRQGQTFGYIERIVSGRRVAVAQPLMGDLLTSVDAGRTWEEFRPSGDIWFPRTRVRALALEPRSETVVYAVVYDGTPKEGNQLVRISLQDRRVDTLAADLPDSAVTDMAVDGDRIWLGTRGQGIRLSTNGGRTFRTDNDGLDGTAPSLHVVDLERTADGKVYALTRAGLYRAGETGTSLGGALPTARARLPGRAALRLPGLPESLQPAGAASARYRVLADGRLSILPLPVSSNPNRGNR